MTEYRGQIGRVRSEPRIRLARIVEIHLALLGRFESPRVQNPAASLQVLCSNDRSGLRLSRNKTLATKAVRGDGPTYRVFGRTVLYRWADALAWAEGRLSAPRRSTSEVRALRRP